MRWIGVTERTRDFADPPSPVLQHPLGGCAPRPLDDLCVGQACCPEPSLQGPDARPHPLGNEIDVCGAAAAEEQRGDDLPYALPGVTSG
jgi:hypothetical protein